MLSNKNFIEKAPKEKVDAEKKKLAEYQQQLEVCLSQLEDMTTNQA